MVWTRVATVAQFAEIFSDGVKEMCQDIPVTCLCHLPGDQGALWEDVAKETMLWAVFCLGIPGSRRSCECQYDMCHQTKHCTLGTPFMSMAVLDGSGIFQQDNAHMPQCTHCLGMF